MRDLHWTLISCAALPLVGLVVLLSPPRPCGHGLGGPPGRHPEAMAQRMVWILAMAVLLASLLEPACAVRAAAPAQPFGRAHRTPVGHSRALTHTPGPDLAATITALAATAQAMAATPTMTPSPSPSPSPTPSPTPPPTGPGKNGQWCFGIIGCLSLGALVGALVNALAGYLSNVFGNLFGSITAPFTAVLTTTPDPTQAGAWAGISTLYLGMTQLAWGLFASLLVIGAVLALLQNMGALAPGAVAAVPWRGILAAGCIAGYTTLAHLAFSAVNGLTAWLMSVPVGVADPMAHLGAVLTGVGDLSGPLALLKVAVLGLGLLFTLLAVFVREAGFAFMLGLYAIGPLALVCWPVQPIAFVTGWWLRSLAGLALWPVGYALLLKVIALLLAPGSPFLAFGDVAATIGAGSLCWGLTRVPHLVGSLAGGASGVIGSTASAPVETGAGVAVTAAKQHVLPGTSGGGIKAP